MIEIVDEALTKIELAALTMPVCLGRLSHGIEDKRVDRTLGVEGLGEAYIDALAVISSGARSARSFGKWRGFEITLGGTETFISFHLKVK